ncbi:MAG: PAS domain-containing protein [Deltaproteobacteria bacterium]|jgi:two-component system sensor histidine kinase HydH|nr:PAS domain-containing protein [Deltaproteobacteria bacterium]
METTQEKEDVFRLPRWLWLLLVTGVLGLAFLMAQRDFGRESLYLEELYVQKGEVLIRSLTTAMRLGWTQGLSRENLAAFNDHLESAEVLYLAVTDVKGSLVSSSVEPRQMPIAAFKSPDSPPSFQKPPLGPHHLVASQPDGQKIFWVYRPLWFTFQPAQPKSHRRRELFSKDRRDQAGAKTASPGLTGTTAQTAPEPTPLAAPDPASSLEPFSQPGEASPEPRAEPVPESLGPIGETAQPGQNSPSPERQTNPVASPSGSARAAPTLGTLPEEADELDELDEADDEPLAEVAVDKPDTQPEDLGDWSKGLYCWVGFDMAPFEAAERTGRRNSLMFIALLGVAGLGGILALFWAYNYRLSRQRYQDTNAMASELITRLPVGLIFNNPQGQVTLVNQAALSLTGLKIQEILGQDLGALTEGAFPEEDDLNGLEMDLRFKNGPTQKLSLSCGPVTRSDGEKLGRVIVMMDVGELNRLKEELERKRRLASLGGMAAGLAHEIRNPLGAIKGLTQHLMSKADPGAQEALEVMLISVDRLERTITDFLDYAKPTELKTQKIDLGSFLRRIHDLVSHDAQSQNVRMSLESPDGEILAQADDGRLAQAFLNLYLNALQAIDPEGGGVLAVRLAVSHQQAIITLADNGPGFGADQLAQPFVPYFTSKSKGSGLGLALVKKIIEAHQGDVALGNRPEGGAIVTVVLPLLSPGDELKLPAPATLPPLAQTLTETSISD